ncbi:hypothetical protein CPB84DRAFT_1777030 [Gymnopilus junonius]|uniref:F-box domain-containing protein n=1 Tax=Gymnopilus junonius TaxID=109634 RepID=A0A9P5NRZ3_GYMJU|nr:hypothetical protein CPB84DRAFT_1777030 [Gymnopilus junonius]
MSHPSAADAVVPHHTANKHAQLNPDVLALIFGFNADPVLDSNALHNLQMYAQVCRAWRYVLLDAQHLWGQVIDLDIFNWQKSQDWSDEVVRRAGLTSSLWIRGTLMERNSVAWVRGADGVTRMEKTPSFVPNFLPSLLDTHWSRAEKFSVNFELQSMDAQLWRDFYLPAPRLRMFSLAGGVHEISTDFSSPLFASTAPCLTSFHPRKLS